MWTKATRAVLQAPDDGGTGGAAPIVDVPKADAVVDVAKLQADLAAAQAQLATHNSAAVEAAKSAEAARQADLAAQGKHQQIADELRKQNDELKADAAVGKGYREREHARIDAAAKDLPPGDKALLDMQPSLEAKAALLARISGTAKPEHRPVGSGGAPAPADVIDFGAAFPDAGKWAAAKARDPKGASAWMASRTAPGLSSVTSISSLLRAPTKTA